MNTQGQLTIDAFNSTLAALGLPPAPDQFAELTRAYNSPDRHYHNQDHIADCLATLQKHHDLAARPAEIAVALWFHDAVYDTHRSDNEERSAQWAAVFLRSRNFEAHAIARIEYLILATKHDAAPTDPDQMLLVDIDLSILGRPRDQFLVYDAAIQREYHWVPQADYRTGRLAVLRGFASRGRIYQTDRFFELFEDQARLNLAHTIASLQGQA